MDQVSATTHSSASLQVRALVLPRARWQITQPWAMERARNDLQFRPVKGTWYGHVIRGKAAHDVAVLAIVGCPSCGRALFLTHSPEAASFLKKALRLPVPVAHSIDHLGKVTPDLQCKHAGCSFHRKVYLDRWNKTKPLFAIAYVDMSKKRQEIEIAYSHAIDAKEARFHLGPGNYSVIAAGPAIGFHYNEKTNRLTAE